MTRLSDTQLTILSAAAQRPDGNLLPLPGSLRGGAAGKVVTALLSRSLVREQMTASHAKADAALTALRRNQEDGRGVLLQITPEGLAALGIKPDSGDEGPHGTAPAASEGAKAGTASEPAAGPDSARVQKTREGTKQAQLVAMLQRPEGATIAQVVEATDWQPHTVRGALAGALKKRLGLTVTSGKADSGDRVYRVQL
jgi:Protein of unknown function (DUF3489)